MKQEFDEKIRNEIKEEIKYIEPSSFLKGKIDQEIKNRQEETEMKKNFGLKKWIAVAAVVCLMVPTTLFAMGKISSYVGITNRKDYSKNWEEVEKLEKQLGIETDVLEKFSNGYEFEGSVKGSFDANDEAGNKLFTVEELSIDYKKDGQNGISCNVHKADERIKQQEQEQKAKPEKTAEFDGVKVELYRNTFKFVPENYEETEEDKKLIKEGNLVLSYGTDEVQIQEYSTVTWEKDGNAYALLGFDLELTADELLQMAGEMIQK